MEMQDKICPVLPELIRPRYSTLSYNNNLVSFVWFPCRWHHIESLLNGGITITVNFWYKVSTNIFLCSLDSSVPEDFFQLKMYWHVLSI